MIVEVEILKTFAANGKHYPQGERLLTRWDGCNRNTVYLDHDAELFTTLVMGADVKLVEGSFVTRDPDKRMLLKPGEVQHLAGTVAERDRIRKWVASRQADGVSADTIVEELMQAVVA